MRNIKLTIEYEGTAYAGWQRQANAPSVQGEIEAVLSRILQEEVSVIGAGRTDAGVHARGQVANFKTLAPMPCQEIGSGLNALLPGDIGIVRIEEVPEDFHARYSARGRRYSYTIIRERSPLMRNFSWHVGYPLDLGMMNQAASGITGSMDFGSFCKGQSEVDDPVCAVTRASWREEGARVLFSIEADRFVHGMVRALVGTMVDVGRGFTTLEGFSEILRRTDRREGGANAPARGLMLEAVLY
jgi:tRNA pseudouridine38-40 synthase